MRHADSHPSKFSHPFLILGIGIVVTLILIWLAGYYITNDDPLQAATTSTSLEEASASRGDSELAQIASRVDVPKSQWKSADLQIEQVKKSKFTETIHLMGTVSLNEDRIAHIYPMVQGVVDEVKISLGDVVSEHDPLVVVHSREVGEAKLDLYQARLQLELAEVTQKLQQEIVTNTQQLLSGLKDQQEITDLQDQLSGQSMGEFREQLFEAYSNFLKSDADLQRLESVGSGAISGKQILAAKANRNADLAIFQARIEQVDYDLKTLMLKANQSVKEASTRVAVATTNLQILGCDNESIRTINPQTQKESISHYFVRAPFSGTVIAKDVALREQVRQDTQILSVADLSTVWIQAEVYEKDIPLLSSLSGTTIHVHNDIWPDRAFEATIFFSGEIMDPQTRTIAVRAIADNPDHLLKPGMFVSIEIPTTQVTKVIQVPTGAIQEHEGQTFVFVHQGGETFHRKNVAIGKSNDQFTVVEQGLTVGDQVVVSGGFIIKSQMLAGMMGEE